MQVDVVQSGTPSALPRVDTSPPTGVAVVVRGLVDERAAWTDPRQRAARIVCRNDEVVVFIVRLKSNQIKSNFELILLAHKHTLQETINVKQNEN